MSGCACKAVDAYDCWAVRYGIRSPEFDDDLSGTELTTREIVEMDGGPCECSCHYENEDDEHSYS